MYLIRDHQLKFEFCILIKTTVIICPLSYSDLVNISLALPHARPITTKGLLGLIAARLDCNEQIVHGMITQRPQAVLQDFPLR
jgi:hypothetical protein